MINAIKGIYKNGKITLLEQPPKIREANVYINFVIQPSIKPRKNTTGQFDLNRFRNALKYSFGSIPKLPDGMEYENNLRKKKEWPKKYEW